MLEAAYADTMLQLGFLSGRDIHSLTWMIAMSGGMENPFASLFLIPIAVAILALPPRLMGVAALTSGAGYFASTLFGRELPPVAGMLGGTFGLHKLGMLANFVVSCRLASPDPFANRSASVR